MPAWATEGTTEANIVRQEADALVAESRSRAWASANTGLLRTIRDGLQDLDVQTVQSWRVVSGEAVIIGDCVMVDLGSVGQGTIEDADPDHRLPLVRITAGPHQGQLLRLTLGQIMRRRRL
jgi:hypothetical protein